MGHSRLDDFRSIVPLAERLAVLEEWLRRSPKPCTRLITRKGRALEPGGRDASDIAIPFNAQTASVYVLPKGMSVQRIGRNVIRVTNNTCSKREYVAFIGDA